MSQSTICTNNTETTSTPCQRHGCANFCEKPNNVTFHRGSYSRASRKYLDIALCNQCTSLCTYVDANKKVCSQSTTKPGLCSHHSKLLCELQNYNDWKMAFDFHEANVYVGSHWEKADEYGPIDIYHYISRSKYEKIINSNPNFDFTRYENYDTEIWLGDKLWSYCGSRAEERLKAYIYPDDFEAKIRTQLLVE